MEPLRWHALEYKHRHKAPDWYWALGILAVASAATAVIVGNVLFAALILIGAFVLALYGGRRPKEVEVVLNEKGLALGGRLYPFATLESFWIQYDEHAPAAGDGARLLVTSNKPFVPHLAVPLSEEVNPQTLREFLAKHVEEREQEESLSERILELFGF